MTCTGTFCVRLKPNEIVPEEPSAFGENDDGVATRPESVRSMTRLTDCADVCPFAFAVTTS